MAPRRRLNKAFKRRDVEEFLAGGVTQAQLARRYDIYLFPPDNPMA